MLLWSLVLAFSAIANRAIPETLRSSSQQGLIGAGFLAFILFTQSVRACSVPAQSGLNPLLEDPGSHSTPFSTSACRLLDRVRIAAAALIRKVDPTWARLAAVGSRRGRC
jgi:cytochrome c biogenesis factor